MFGKINATAALLLAMGAQSVFAHSFSKTVADPDHNWATPANWASGVVPNLANTSGGDFGNGIGIGAPNIFAGSVDNGHATVNSAVPDIDNTIYVGINGGSGTLEILPGGSLTNFNTLVVGEAACCGDGDGTILMSGGTFNVNTWAQFANRASLGATATSNWIQTGGAATIEFMNGWAGDHPANLGTGTANFQITGGSLEIPNGVGPHENVNIVIGGTGQYIVANDWTNDPTLGGIVSAAPGMSLVASFAGGNTTISAVPEPTSFALLAFSGVVMLMRRRMR